MEPGLGPRARSAGYRLAAFETIGSTNSEAMARGRSGDPGRLWVFSAHQSSGRGRRGRAWETPRGNMAASLLSIVTIPPATAATLGFVAGLALAEALESVLPRSKVRVGLDGAGRFEGGAARDRISLKWPNDVLLGDAKLAGILLEAEPIGAGRLAVVVGIGVNVVSAPEGLPYPATSLAALGVAVQAETLFRNLAEAWVGIVDVWREARGLEPIRHAWLDRAHGIGEPVVVKIGPQTVRGTFETLDSEGRLVIAGDDGTRHTIAAGEVHFGVAASGPTAPPS